MEGGTGTATGKINNNSKNEYGGKNAAGQILLRSKNRDKTKRISLKASNTIDNSYTITFPSSDGTEDQLLKISSFASNDSTNAILDWGDGGSGGVTEYANYTAMHAQVGNVTDGAMGLIGTTLYIRTDTSGTATWYKIAVGTNANPTWTSIVQKVGNTTISTWNNPSGSHTFNLSGGVTTILELNATDAEGASLTYTFSGTPPTNMLTSSIQLSGNILTLISSATTAGTFALTLNASDGVNTITVSPTILLAFQPPTWRTSGNGNAITTTYPTASGSSTGTFILNSDGNEMDITLHAVDPDTTTLTYTITGTTPSDPGNMLQTVYNSNSAKYSITGNVIKITPSTNTSHAGSVVFNISVTDGNSTITASITLSLSFSLYSMPSPSTFTNCGATGRYGPTLTQCRAVYPHWADSTQNLDVISGIQYWTVPDTATYTIVAYGADATASQGGRGAIIGGNFNLTKGEIIKILVGQRVFGGAGTSNHNGAGGTFVVSHPYNTNNSILVIAGGGGGAHNYGTTSAWEANVHGQSGTSGGQGYNNRAGGTNGGAGTSPAGYGGSGFFGNATGGGSKAFIYGGVGGVSGSFQAGFGGGSRHGNTHGGGGGGYSGGGGSADYTYHGGGGGSYNNGSSQTTLVGSSNGWVGEGKVVVTKL